MNQSGWDDPAIRDGMRRMLALRSELRERGDRSIGWKLAFGAPAWLEKFGLAGPLVGFLPESGRHEPGAKVSCEGWVNPVAEPEIAAHLGDDVDDPNRAEEAISGLGVAIELADVDAPPEDIGEVLGGNVFHRAVILGPPQNVEIGSLRGRVFKNGSEIADIIDLESLTGDLVSILRHSAALLDAAGEKLRAGEVVIMGSVIPPIQVESADEVKFELAPLSPISVVV